MLTLEQRAYQRSYYLAHRAKKLAYQREYQVTHREPYLEYQRAHYDQHKDEYHAANEAYRESHADQIVAQKRQYHEDHASQIMERVRAWRTANPARRAAHSAKRNAAKRGAKETTLTATEWGTILDLFKRRCAYCGTSGVALEQDHVIPLSRGGAHTRGNVVPSCRSCNSRKSAGFPLVPVQVVLL